MTQAIPGQESTNASFDLFTQNPEIKGCRRSWISRGFTVVNLAPDYYFILIVFRHSRSARGVRGSRAKPKYRAACMKINSGVVFYTSDLCLPGSRSFDCREVFTRGAIPYPGSPQVITKPRHRRPYPRYTDTMSTHSAVIHTGSLGTGQPQNTCSRQLNTISKAELSKRSHTALSSWKVSACA